jgi:hypothetical protein
MKAVFLTLFLVCLVKASSSDLAALEKGVKSILNLSIPSVNPKDKFNLDNYLSHTEEIKSLVPAHSVFKVENLEKFGSSYRRAQLKNDSEKCLGLRTEIVADQALLLGTVVSEIARLLSLTEKQGPEKGSPRKAQGGRAKSKQPAIAPSPVETRLRSIVECHNKNKKSKDIVGDLKKFIATAAP